jgi:hypothetical protein
LPQLKKFKKLKSLRKATKKETPFCNFRKWFFVVLYPCALCCESRSLCSEKSTLRLSGAENFAILFKAVQFNNEIISNKMSFILVKISISSRVCKI